MYEDYLPPVVARKKRDPEPQPASHAVTKPSWQGVGLPGSDGWLSRMQQRGPDGRAEVMSELQQTTGNRNVSRALARSPAAPTFWDTITDFGEQLIDRAMTFQIGGSVGKGGKNKPEDVQRVRMRLKTLGYPTTDGGDNLVGAILAYQYDVVGLKKADGRIDPGGKTLAKLNEGATATKPKPAADAPTSTPAAPTTSPSTTPAAPSTPAPTTSEPTPPAGPGRVEEETPGTTVTPTETKLQAGSGKGIKDVYAELDRVRALVKQADARAKELDKAASKAVSEAKKKKDAAAEAAAEFTRVNTQESGQERDDLVKAIQGLRAKVEALTPAEAGLSDPELKKAKAAIWREVARLSPFYYQIVNADILYTEVLDKKTKLMKEDHTGGSRTCNVTSLSMTLEALGKSAADYKHPDAALIPFVYATFNGRLDTTARDRVTKDPAGLRLPDFLQLLAVVKMLPKAATVELAQKNPAAFAEEVEKGRDLAVDKILQSGWFHELISGFGTEADNDYPFAGMKVGDVNYSDIIERVGEINRSNLPKALKKYASTQKKGVDKLTDEEKASVTASVVKYYDEDLLAKDKDKKSKKLSDAETKLAEKEAALKDPAKKGKKGLESEIRNIKCKIYGMKLDERLSTMGINKAAADPKELDKIIPIELYASKVAAALNARLDLGYQVVGHMHNHFFRVESVEADGVIIDDPGTSSGKNKKLTWHQARAVGCFTRFTWVKPK